MAEPSPASGRGPQLVVGLGNPGPQYEKTRHNVGFMVADLLAGRLGGTFKVHKRSGAEIVTGRLGNRPVILAKPRTYMNESGRSVGEAVRFLKIAEGEIVAFHDELDLAPGKIKVKTGGGNAGHNGLRSITQHVGNEFVRVRIGIGHPGAKELVHGYVLHDFARADEAWLETLLDAMSDAAGRLATGDPARFLTDVARVIQSEDDPKPKPAPTPPSKPPGGSHPAGERTSKRQSALAENIRKWMKGRSNNS